MIDYRTLVDELKGLDPHIRFLMGHEKCFLQKKRTYRTLKGANNNSNLFGIYVDYLYVYRGEELVRVYNFDAMWDAYQDANPVPDYHLGNQIWHSWCNAMHHYAKDSQFATFMLQLEYWVRRSVLPVDALSAQKPSPLLALKALASFGSRAGSLLHKPAIRKRR